MIREIDYEITSNEAGMKACDFLRSRGYSEKLLTLFRKSPDSLSVNGKHVYTIYRLACGDMLHVRIEEKEGSEHVRAVEPELMPEIVYEDEDILVINKPQRMPVHPSMEHYTDTLGNAVMWHLQKEYETEAVTFRIINRLDKDTSGLTLIAKNRLSAAILSEAMVNRKIHRTYLALCDGAVSEEGTVDAPIKRVEGSVLERCVDFESGESAVTHFKRLGYEKNGDYSLVRLWLETGRTHQIRVHMKYIGHPLLGDFLYNPEDKRRTTQALHSYMLTFSHPLTGKELTFTCPPEFGIETSL